MTIEENKAIKDLKEEIKSLEKAKIEFSNEIEDKDWLRKNINELDKDIFYKNTLLNLIEKLQKETIPTKYYACDPNKHKECKKKHCYINGGECDATIDETKVKYINLENYIPKEKIREKIQKLENGEQCYYEFSTGDLVDLLKELLEEG